MSRSKIRKHRFRLSCIGLMFLALVGLPRPGLAQNDGASAISAEDYQDVLGIGFATSWFKTSNLGKDYTLSSLTTTMSDLKAAGFSNLRLRSRADIWGFADTDSDNFVAATDINQASMDEYLAELDIVLDASLAAGVAPTISWIHHSAEGRANTDDGDNFVEWWGAVATHTANRDYRLSFNLMTEVGNQDSNGDGISGVFDSSETWNDWTSRAIGAIRDSGGNNAHRNIIITSPRNTKVDSLDEIDSEILEDEHLLLEYHAYAAGPSAQGRNEWTTGTAADKARLTDRLVGLEAFSDDNSIPAYWGAWMPFNNKSANVPQQEAEAFGHFFGQQLAERGIPWSMNELSNYYDSENNQWRETKVFGAANGNPTTFNVADALAATLEGHLSVSVPVLLGDVNLDGTVNNFDISPFSVILFAGTFQAEADCNESGAVDNFDISAFVAILFAGDF